MRNDITGIHALAPVTRRIDRPVEWIIQAIDAIDTALAGGRLQTRSPWRPVASTPVPAWEARARLVVDKEGLRRWTSRSSTPVRVELTAWSPAAAELSLWPVSPGFARWGARRQQRYFVDAHAVAAAAARERWDLSGRGPGGRSNMGGWRPPTEPHAQAEVTGSSSRVSAGSRSSRTPVSPTT